MNKNVMTVNMAAKAARAPGRLGGLLVAALAANFFAAGATQAQTYVFNPLAGAAATLDHTDGTGANARLLNPTGVAVDSAGNIYVADGGDHTVRRVTSGGVTTTIAGSSGQAGSVDGTGGGARFVYPYGIALDGAGNVFVTDIGDHTIRRITPAGVVTTIAGTAGIIGSADGVGPNASFNTPDGIAVDSSGNLYVADTNNSTVRRIASTGTVTTIGFAGQIGSVDGSGGNARFNFPTGVATDSAGNVYVADFGNSTIRKISGGSNVTTYAGAAQQTGVTDGVTGSARFDHPAGVSVDTAGNVYVIDTSNQTVRKISIATGSVSTLAGSPGAVGNVEGSGAVARFFYPFGIAVTGAGAVYVADTGNHSVRAVTAAGAVSTLAGAVGSSGITDGTGTAARFKYPDGLAIDGSGNLFVADHDSNTIRKIAANGSVTTLAGSAGVSGSTDGAGGNARFSGPTGVAVDGSGNVYIADAGNNSIRKITAAGLVSTFATGFRSPQGVAVDSAGNVYVADTNNHAIRKITAGGSVSTLAGNVGQNGNNDGVGGGARFNSPYAVVVDGAGNVYVADFGNGTIRKIDAGGTVTTLAGLAGKTGMVDGFGAVARFNQTYGIAVDGGGTVYVTDTYNRAVRRISAAGNVSTLTGSNARFYYPEGIVVDGAGNLYVADGDNQAVIKGTAFFPPSSGGTVGSFGVTTGGSAIFSIAAISDPSASVQWQVSTDNGASWNNVSDNVNSGGHFSGTTTSSLTVSAATTGMNGNRFRAVVTNPGGTGISGTGALTVAAAPPAGSGTARIVNISARTFVGAGSESLIVGFAIAGSGAKQILVRGIGPTLTQFEVTGVLANPTLSLFDGGGGFISTDTQWGGGSSMAQVFASVGAFALPQNSADSAIVRTLNPGTYSAQLAGLNGTTGIALVELYDSDPGTPASRYVNISARALVGAGQDALTAGFVIGGTGTVTVLIRGIGPTLANYGVTGALARPQLLLLNSDHQQIALNAGWGGGTTLAAAFSQVAAFALAADSADAALLVNLPPGLYSVQMNGVGATTGIGLIEVYEVR